MTPQRARQPSPPPLAALAVPVVLALLAALAVPTAGLAARAAPADASPPPTALFNGRDLAGWTSWLVDSRHADPRRVFTVTNGLLRLSGDGLGYLATDREFADYRLAVEWRWGTTNTRWGDRLGKARDSGLFLHAIGPDGNSHDGQGAFMAAIECNLFQGAVGDLLLIRGTAADGTLLAPRLVAEVAPAKDPEGWFTWQPAGRAQPIERWGRLNAATKSPDWRDLTDFRGPRDVEKPPGEWNVVVCEARADRLRVFVNGTPVNEARGLHPHRGRILLQCEGSEIFFRRVELTPLAAPAGREPSASGPG